MTTVLERHVSGKFIYLNKNLVRFPLAVRHQNLKAIITRPGKGLKLGHHWGGPEDQPRVLFRFAQDAETHHPSARDFAILLHLIGTTRNVEAQDIVVREARVEAKRLRQKGEDCWPRDDGEARQVRKGISREQHPALYYWLSRWDERRPYVHISAKDGGLLTERTLVTRLRNDPNFAGMETLEFYTLADLCVACGFADTGTRSIRTAKASLRFWSKVGLEFPEWRENGRMQYMRFDPVVECLRMPDQGQGRVVVKLNPDLVRAVHPSRGYYAKIKLPLPVYSDVALNLWLYGWAYKNAGCHPRTLSGICDQIGLRYRNLAQAKARLRGVAASLTRRERDGMHFELKSFKSGRVKIAVTNPNRPPEFDPY